MEGDVDDAAEHVWRHRCSRRVSVAADVLEVALRQVHDGAALARQRRDGARARVPQLQTHGATTGPGGHRRRLRLRLLLVLLLHGVEVNARHGPGRPQQLAPRKEQTTAAKRRCGRRVELRKRVRSERAGLMARGEEWVGGGGGGGVATHGGDGHEWLGWLACRRGGEGKWCGGEGRSRRASRAQTGGRPTGLRPLKYCPLLPLVADKKPQWFCLTLLGRLTASASLLFSPTGARRAEAWVSNKYCSCSGGSGRRGGGRHRAVVVDSAGASAGCRCAVQRQRWGSDEESQTTD